MVFVTVFAFAPIAALQAETLKWARAGDALTLDPHGQFEGPTITLAHQIYESLLLRDTAGQIIPALAMSWAVLPDNPNVWRFELRPNVLFHNGAAFTADDVVYSINRASMPTSGVKEHLSSVKEVRKVDDLTVDIETNGPNPLLVNNLTNMFMMDSDWAEENGVSKPQDVSGGETTFAATNTNGTGAYMLVSRAVDEKTVLKANPDYWGKDEFPLQITEIIYTPISSASTRVAALLSGEVDFIQDVPVQDLKRVNDTDGLKVVKAAENRVIFFGMNTTAVDLKSDSIEGTNPFADVRVRRAMNMAINRGAIHKVVMRGQSDPTNIIMAPYVNGWKEALNALPKGSTEDAKNLMVDAGFGEGFSVALDCPNDRYINDEAICQALVGMMAKIGVEVNLSARPKAQHFPLVQNKTSEFYMLGWGEPSFDSHNILNFLVHTTTEDRGSWNKTGFSNADVDSMVVSLESETDLDARNKIIGKIWATVQEEQIYLPIHNQVLNWGMKGEIDFDVHPDNQPHFKFMSMN